MTYSDLFTFQALHYLAILLKKHMRVMSNLLPLLQPVDEYSSLSNQRTHKCKSLFLNWSIGYSKRCYNTQIVVPRRSLLWEPGVRKLIDQYSRNAYINCARS